MPSYNSYGLPVLMWDAGYLLSQGQCIAATSSLSPTGSNPAVWELYHAANDLIIEEIRLFSDTTIGLHIASSNLGQSATTIYGANRFLGLSYSTFSWNGQVKATVGTLTAILDGTCQGNSDVRMLNGNWLGVKAGQHFVIYTDAVAANVTLNVFYRYF